MVIAKLDPVDLQFTMNSGTESVKSSLAAVIAIANTIRAMREVHYLCFLDSTSNM